MSKKPFNNLIFNENLMVFFEESDKTKKNISIEKSYGDTDNDIPELDENDEDEAFDFDDNDLNELGDDSSEGDEELNSNEENENKEDVVTPEEAKENEKKYKLFSDYNKLLQISLKFKEKLYAIDSYDVDEDFSKEITTLKRKLLTMSKLMNQLFDDFDILENDVIEKTIANFQKYLTKLTELLIASYNKYVVSDEGETNSSISKVKSSSNNTSNNYKKEKSKNTTKQININKKSNTSNEEDKK